jgi:hypothetical protein
MVFRESINVGLIWRKHLSDLEADLQGFLSEEKRNSDILDMVCAMRSLENVNKDNVGHWLQSDVRELGFQHMTDMDPVNAAAKHKGEEEGGEDESEEEGQSSEHVSHTMVLQCFDSSRLQGSESLNIVTLQPPGTFVLL